MVSEKYSSKYKNIMFSFEFMNNILMIIYFLENSSFLRTVLLWMLLFWVAQTRTYHSLYNNELERNLGQIFGVAN